MYEQNISPEVFLKTYYIKMSKMLKEIYDLMLKSKKSSHDNKIIYEGKDKILQSLILLSYASGGKLNDIIDTISIKLSSESPDDIKYVLDFIKLYR